MASNLHPDLEDDQLHVCKDFANGSNGQSPWRNEKSEQTFDNKVILPQALSLASSYSAPPTEVMGDVYLITGTSNHADWDLSGTNSWTRYDGTTWNGMANQEGELCYNKQEHEYDIFDGTNWNTYSTGGVAKKYVALLSQTGTSAPTIYGLLEDTTGVTITPTYSGVGIYNLSFSSSILTPDSKISVSIQNSFSGVCDAYVSSSSNVTIETRTFLGVAGNAILTRTPIEIIIYR